MTNGRSTRRVTLSHVELEEFLSDSGQSIEVNPRGYREVELSECDNLITPRKMAKDGAYTFRANSDEESIREFCLVSRLNSCQLIHIEQLPNFNFKKMSVGRCTTSNHDVPKSKCVDLPLNSHIFLFHS